MDTFFSDDDDLDLTDTEVNKRSKDKDDDSLIIVQDEASQTEIIYIDTPERSKSKISDDIIDLDSFVEDVEGSSSFKSELRSKDRRYEKEKDSSVHIIPVTKIIDDLEDYEDVISDSDSEILPPVIWNHSRSEKNKWEDGKTLGDSTAKLPEDNESCFAPGKSFLVKVKKTGDLDKSIKTMKEEKKQDDASHKKSSREKTVTFSQVSVKKTGSGSENKEKESNFEEMFRSAELQGYATSEKSVKSLDTVETKIRKSKKEAKKRRSDESDVISKDILDGVSKSKQARKAPESPGTMLQIKRTIKNVKRPEPPKPFTPAVTVSIDDLLTEMQRDQKKPTCTLPTPVLSSDSSNEGAVGHDVVMEESSMEIQGVGSDLPDLDDSSSSVTDSSQNASSKKDTENEVTSSVLECEVCRETENANTVVQCCDGHLVCSKCVEKQVKLVLDPSNKENVVSCPAENCLTYIPESQAKKVLPNLIMELLQEKFHKQAMETITKMEDLHSCPFCGFAVLVETEIKEFECWNCKKKSCRYCKRPWQFADHSSCDRFTTQEDDSEEFTLPKYWHPMEGAANESFLTVQLDPNSREFSRVHDLCKNALKKVTSIRRIQNPRLWQKFSLTKKHMLEDIGRQQLNEKQLFHGTNYMAIEGICKDGLDWRMCGVNGTAFGQGTYFAKDASYSDRYCHVVNTLDFGQGTNTVIVPNQQQPFTFGQSSGQNNAGSGFGVNPQLMAQLQQLHGNTWISSHNINANVYNPSKPPVLRVPKNFLFSSQNNVGLIFGAGTGSGTGNQQSGTPSFGQGGAQQQQQQPTFGAAPLAPGFGTANPGFGAQNPAKFGTPNPGFGAQNPAKFGTPNPGFGAQNPASGFGTITYGTTFGQKPAAGPCDSTQNDNTEGVTSNIQKILKKGHKYLFIARVLVGKSAPGASGLRKPPVDQADPKKRHFNSCVNQVQSPSIFVIFDSSQCYPEYLVEYQVSGRKGPH
ncbi:hypothetical protein FSP39_012840 [Pinctada imbricata]|uniref:Poly [ADP-ribose] polymerase n=1 Tax=Pinctada imbricata TaxID=66713 RepID=A0AA89C6D3_PINIB|nr:hypothetical protein FSP39_012840 [Pinctada imbricata]